MVRRPVRGQDGILKLFLFWRETVSSIDACQRQGRRYLLICMFSYALLGCLSIGPHPKELAFQNQGAFYALSVDDFDGIITWYTTHLGFEIESRGENVARKGALLRRPGVLLEIGAFGTAKSRIEWGVEAESHEVEGIFKIGFQVADLDALFAYAEQQELDVFFPIVNASNEFRTFGVKDPEGNIVQFFGE